MASTKYGPSDGWILPRTSSQEWWGQAGKQVQPCEEISHTNYEIVEESATNCQGKRALQWWCQETMSLISR